MPHQLALTPNVLDAVCDQMLDHSAGESRAHLCQGAGADDLLGRSTLLEIVPQDGETLIAAERERARAVLDEASAEQRALLGILEACAGEEALSDVPPCDVSEEKQAAWEPVQAAWEPVQAAWAVTGFHAREPEFPVAAYQPPDVDPGSVIVVPNEVKTKAQPSTVRKEVWTLLLALGVLRGERRCLVLGDGAAWIRTWFEGMGVSLQAMLVCWCHLRKCSEEQLGTPGGPKVQRRALEKAMLGHMWQGKLDAAVDLLRDELEWVRKPQAIKDLFESEEKRRANLPDFQHRQQEGCWSAPLGWSRSTIGWSPSFASTVR